MKRFTLITVCLFVFSILHAQNNNSNWRSRFSINAGAYFTIDDTGARNYLFTVEYGFLYKEKLLLGIGTGASLLREAGKGGTLKRNYIPVYAGIKYFLPVSGKVSFVSGADIGYSIITNPEKRSVIIDGNTLVTKRSGEFLISPQVGFSFRVGEKSALALLLGYRYEYTHALGLKVGFAF